MDKKTTIDIKVVGEYCDRKCPFLKRTIDGAKCSAFNEQLLYYVDRFDEYCRCKDCIMGEL